MAAINSKEDEILSGDCKWTDQKTGEQLLEKLKKRSKKVQWRNKEREVKYILLSKSRFTEELQNQEVELVKPEKLFFSWN